MVSGTDEHGTPILVQAEREGLTTRETADKYNRVIVEDLQGLGLSYDLFTRTITRNHYQWCRSSSWVCTRTGTWSPRPAGCGAPSTGRTLPDRYIEGTCPICGYDSARGDQCDNCGNQLDPADLINPRSRINGETPKFIETEHYFLDLPALAGSLGKWLREPDRLAAERAEVQPEPARGPASPGRSPAISTGACRCRWTAGGTSR